jgi:hypothetical protein
MPACPARLPAWRHVVAGSPREIPKSRMPEQDEEEEEKQNELKRQVSPSSDPLTGLITPQQ